MAKTIDKIKYRPAGQTGIEVILVRMDASLHGSTKFYCILQSDPQVKTEGTDLNKTLTDIRKLIDDKFAIKWESKLRVSFEGDLLDEDEFEHFVEKGIGGLEMRERSVRLKLTVTPMLVATNAEGKTIYKEGDGHYINRGNPTEVNLNNREKEVQALIDDTVENRQRLASIFKAFGTLHGRLMEMFEQKNIATTLQSKNLLGMEKKK